MTDIEHATAEEIEHLAQGNLLNINDCEVLSDALLVVTKMKHMKDKMERVEEKNGSELAFIKIMEEMLDV